MKHETKTNQGISNLTPLNRPFENYFLNHEISKNNHVPFNLNYCEVAYVVGWQMENNKPDISIGHQ
jgi:hypothetical protein